MNIATNPYLPSKPKASDKHHIKHGIKLGGPIASEEIPKMNIATNPYLPSKPKASDKHHIKHGIKLGGPIASEEIPKMNIATNPYLPSKPKASDKHHIKHGIKLGGHIASDKKISTKEKELPDKFVAGYNKGDCDFDRELTRLRKMASLNHKCSQHLSLTELQD